MIYDNIKIERQSKEILPYIINANSHRGIILSLLTKFRRDAERGYTYTPLELKQVFEEALTKYNELKNKSDIVTLELPQWKGKDLPEIFDGFENEFKYGDTIIFFTDITILETFTREVKK